ncbi:DUF6994 family protein [Ruminococcus sp.]
MKTNEEITSYEPKNFKENYKAYLVDLLTKDYEFCKSREAAEKKCNKIVLDLRKKGEIIKDKSESSNKLYIDPDKKENEEFYRELSNFLNASRISRKNNKILSFEANEAPYGMITVYYKDKYGNKQHFTVHSDQFGFSAVPCIYFRKNYPLSRYLEMQKNKSDKLKNKSDKKLETVAKFLSEYVYTTRTLGGSFLWPEDWYKGYNMERGNGSYIEDRVDLTLLEIKHIYKFRELENQLIYGKDYLFKRYKNQYADKWFGFFDSFEDYVDFFMFNDFVEDISTNGKKEYMPINILTGKRFKTDYPGYEMDTLKDIKEYKLKAMLERVRDMVEKRTIRMEDLINEYKQTNDTKGEKHENILHE